MEPAAVLAVVVKARGVVPTNAQLKSVQTNLVKAEAAGAAFGSGLEKSSSRAARAGSAMQGAGRSINRGLGLPLLAITALSAKAAVDFEDSFADIRKTVNATEPQFAKLETGVRRLAKHIPISTRELNELGGEAGALGIKRKALLPFIKTAAELGTTTDLSSDEAANALARLSNIMGTSDKDFRRLGSTFVDLGNKGASTEQEIANMALRIAGAGKQVGLSESEVLGFGSALASVGVRAEAGGSAISKVFSEMAVNVATGTKKVHEFGRVAGISGSEFSKLFKEDAGEAMILFIEGLDRIRKSGGNVYGVLENLELKDIRIRDSLLRAAGAGKLFREQLKVGSVEWQQNNALTQEAAKRYGTTASKIEIAKNKIYDVGITLGQNLLPVIADTLEIVSDIAHVFGSLPPELQVNILKFMALVVAVGIFLSLAGKLVSAYAQIPKLISWVIGAQAAQTTATEVQTAANIELAASLAAAATAQRELLIANKSGAVVGSVPIAPPTATAATGAARSTAMSFAAGLVRLLPWAFAAVGVANIISSLMGGDTRGAAFKAGGAAAGAIAGGIAFGLPGALIGAGIGSILGGVIGDLFDSPKEITAFQEAIAASAGKVERALKRQKAAGESLSTTNQKIMRIGRRQKDVSQEVKHAEDRLTAARRGGKAGAPEVRKAEASLAIWKGRNLRLTRQQSKAEHIHGIALWGFKQAAKASVIAMRERSYLLQEEVGKAASKLQQDKRQHAGLQVIEKDFRRWNRASKELRENQGKLGGKLQEVARLAGDKYAAKLKGASLSVLKWGKNVSNLTGPMRKLAPSITPITVLMKKFGDRGKSSTEDVKKGVNKVKGAMGPFQTEATQQLGKVTSSFKSWKVASNSGVTSVEKKLGGFAMELGMKDVKFGTTTAKGPKKQRGGMVVPGAGTGDKVPLTAMVEPGEVVHVLNMRASKDRHKLAALETMNQTVPRFQSGGSMFVDPAGPGTGVVNRAIAGVVGQWSTRYNAAINYGYDPGGGHISPGHNVTGTATDTGPAAGWETGTPLFEQGLRAIESKVDQILYGSHGIGEAYPNHGWGNHAHIEWGMHPDVQGMLGSLIPKLKMNGPEGALKDVGQAVLDKAVQMANKKMQQLGGIGGGPDLNLQGIEGSIASQAAQIAKATGSPRRSTLALFEALWAESSMGSASPGNVLQALGSGGAPIGSAAEEISGFLTGHPTWTGTAAIPLARSTDWPAHVIAQAVQKSAFSSGSNYLAQKQRALDTMSQFGLQEGGLLGFQSGGSTKAAQKSVPIQKQVKNVLTGMREGKHLPKYQAQLKKLGRRISGIGISEQRAARLGDTTKDIEKFAEFASNASAMTRSVENPATKEEEIIQGVFKGKNEGAWLNDQLGALMRMRGELVSVHGTIADKQLPRVDKLMQDARERLRHVRKAIRDAEDRKRELERKIKEIEKAQNENKHELEQRQKELERALDKEQGAKNPNKDRIAGIRSELSAVKSGLSDNDKKSNGQIKDIKQKITDINEDNKGRKRVETSLTGTIIPGFEAQHTGMHETLANLFGDGGELKGANFIGLKTVQGAGGVLDDVASPPPYGMFGGEIFNVQDRLRIIQEEMERKSEPGETGPSQLDEEKLAVANELAEEFKKKYIVSQYQFGVLQGMPDVSASQEVVPFAGAYAKGGIVAAEVGERGREIAVMPQGSRVVPSHEARAALAGGGNGDFNVRNLHLGPDGTIEGEMEDGRRFRKKVKKVTKEQGSSRKTPGGKW